MGEDDSQGCQSSQDKDVRVRSCSCSRMLKVGGMGLASHEDET